MKPCITVAACLALLAVLARDANAVPVTTAFAGRISDADGPLDTACNLVFEIYDNPSGGTLQWAETHLGVVPEGGLVYVELGTDSGNGLDESVFTGGDMFLELTVNGVAQSPRIPILSVPYAIRAATADTLGTLAPGDVALAGHDHDTDYAAMSHDHTGVYAPAGHAHDSDYAAQSHSHGSADINAYQDLSDSGRLDNNGGSDILTRSQGDGRYAGSSHSHGSGDLDAYQDLSDSGRLDNSGGSDILTRSQLDARYLAGITTSATSGLAGGCTSGACTMSVDPTDFNAVPVSSTADYTDFTDKQFHTFRTETIDIPAAGYVIAMLSVSAYCMNCEANHPVVHWHTRLCSSPDCDDTSEAMYSSIYYNANATSWEHEGYSTHELMYFDSPGTKTIYARAKRFISADANLRLQDTRLTLLYIPQ